MHQGQMMLVLALLCAPAAAEEIYRWQDATGHWHFGSGPAAPPQAAPAATTTPISIVEMKRATPKVGGEADWGRSAGRRVTHEVDIASERERKRAKCDSWRERLRHSRKGLRDHEGQAAYERECILNMRW